MAPPISAPSEKYLHPEQSPPFSNNGNELIEHSYYCFSIFATASIQSSAVRIKDSLSPVIHTFENSYGSLKITGYEEGILNLLCSLINMIIKHRTITDMIILSLMWSFYPMNIEGGKHGAKPTWLESVIYLETVALVLWMKFYFFLFSWLAGNTACCNPSGQIMLSGEG